mmetsp:Transcript_22835/g.58540  ORF Transcript_22835/g.58540 Transcript_22835/m.58540 type:complete len:232 (+) Transcript_22835:3068-3763(+)
MLLPGQHPAVGAQVVQVGGVEGGVQPCVGYALSGRAKDGLPSVQVHHRSVPVDHTLLQRPRSSAVAVGATLQAALGLHDDHMLHSRIHAGHGGHQAAQQRSLARRQTRVVRRTWLRDAQSVNPHVFAAVAPRQQRGAVQLLPREHDSALQRRPPACLLHCQHPRRASIPAAADGCTLHQPLLGCHVARRQRTPTGQRMKQRRSAKHESAPHALALLCRAKYHFLVCYTKVS